MRIRTVRVSSLALALLLVACATQVTAPREGVTPQSSAAATPRPTNASNDVLHVRKIQTGGSQIVSIDARTGATFRTLPDGALSSDRSTAHWGEFVNGGTQTVIRVTDISTGVDLRSFTLNAGLRMASGGLGLSALSHDGRRLALASGPSKVEQDWLSKFMVVDATSGVVQASAEFKSQLQHYVFAALSPDGRWLYLNEFPDRMACGPGGCTSGLGMKPTIRPRVFDVAAQRLLPAEVVGTAWDELSYGFSTPAVTSPNGRWVYTLWAIDTEAPAILALDLVNGRVERVPLPEAQRSGFEQYMLWSTAITRDGGTLYAVNPALGVVNEVDAGQLTLRRTAKLSARSNDGSVLAAIARLVFPVAAAKRSLSGGAMLSPDGRTIYAAGDYGLAVIDAGSLRSRAVWYEKHQFSSLAVSADGARLYAVGDGGDAILIINTADGVSLGEIETRSAMSIVRVDSR